MAQNMKCSGVVTRKSLHAPGRGVEAPLLRQKLILGKTAILPLGR
jgi:hypothetical protein